MKMILICPHWIENECMLMGLFYLLSGAEDDAEEEGDSEEESSDEGNFKDIFYLTDISSVLF